ncbi:MAG: cyclodeaminase/cyclohydrolase family protein [Candidatus Omnitrophota bacterium]
MYSQKQLSQYINDLASGNSAPGGGSAAAVVASLGIALSSMVARFSLNQKLNKLIKVLLKKNEILRRKLVLLIDRDIIVYLKLEDSRKIPKSAKQRKILIEKNLKQAVLVPLEVCRLINSAMQLCQEITMVGNKNLITDSGCAVLFLASAFSASRLNIKINLKYMKDKKFVKTQETQLRKMEKNVFRIKKIIEKQIKEFM